MNYGLTLDLFPDPAEGERRREEAIRRVGENAGDDWREVAHECLEEVVSEKRKLTSDDVRELLVERGHWPPPNDPRALGAVMRAAQKRGLIEPTGEYTPSRYACSHRRPQRYWVAK